MKIIKKGIEKHYYPQTTNSLKGYVVKKYGVELFIIDDTTYFTKIGHIVVGVYKCCGSFLLLSLIISEGDIITYGTIADDNGVEQAKIEINRYL